MRARGKYGVKRKREKQKRESFERHDKRGGKESALKRRPRDKRKSHRIFSSAGLSLGVPPARTKTNETHTRKNKHIKEKGTK